MERTRTLATWLLVVALAGCASLNRGCSSWNAEQFGSDWIVVQYKFDGNPINCWTLRDVSITNETGSDGIYWKDTSTGHLVHISGWYNRVQVKGERFDEAAVLLGVVAKKCGNGVYLEGG